MAQLFDPFADGATPLIPDPRWQALSLPAAAALFQDAPFEWAIAGGYCIELFVGQSYRPHEDVDILVFRDEQRLVQRWLSDWCLYAADPPGHLRRWIDDEYLPIGIHDVWAHRPDIAAWQFQLMIAEQDGAEWFYRNDSSIRGRRVDLIKYYNELPCVRIDIQLFYKSRGKRAKDEADFERCLPLLSIDEKYALAKLISRKFPEGHRWLPRLTA
jgi:hypothetical protein